MRSRRLRLSLLAAFLIAVTWVGARAWIAKGELEDAQGLVDVLKTQISEGTYDGAGDLYVEIRDHTTTARAMVDDPLWSLAERVPFLGANLRVMRQVTEGVDDAITAASPLVDVATTLDPAALAPKDGRIPIEPFVEAAVAISSAGEDFAELAPRVRAIDTGGTLGPLQAAHTKLVELVDSIDTTLTTAGPIVDALPAMLGANGPRTYVVMFLNNAELRSLGGSATTFAQVTVDNGEIQPPLVIPAGGGNMEPHPGLTVIDVPDGFDDIYPLALGRWIANATLRPSGETAAQIVAAEWQRMYGLEIDGVISMDGGALSSLLQAVGPITLPTGDVVSSENVLGLLFNEVYQRYNTGDLLADDAAQGAVYAGTVALTFARLSSGQFDPMVLFSTMLAAGEQHHVSMWFANDAERAALVDTALAARDLPESTPTEDVVGVYLNDQVGSKLNYYLASTMTTGTAACGPDGRQVHRITMTLTSTLPPEAVPGLSPSITGLGYEALGLERGLQRMVVFLYLPPGAEFAGIRVAGVSTPPSGKHDTGRSVQDIWVDVPPGGTTEFSFDVLMPEPNQRALVVDVTPTVQGTVRATEPLECSGVTLP